MTYLSHINPESSGYSTRYYPPKQIIDWNTLVCREVLSKLFKCRARLNPGRVKSKTENWHLLLPWLAFTIKGLEQDWLAQRQFKVTGWGIVFICGMVLRCVRLESGPVTEDLTTTVVYSYKVLTHDVKPVHSHPVTTDWRDTV